MRKYLLGPNVAVFLLFFGIALLDAIRLRDWIRSALWLAVGLVFLWGDTLGRRSRSRTERR
jgi:galactitol-specific phosphotransferase system IIC component